MICLEKFWFIRLDSKAVVLVNDSSWTRCHWTSWWGMWAPWTEEKQSQQHIAKRENKQQACLHLETKCTTKGQWRPTHRKNESHQLRATWHIMISAGSTSITLVLPTAYVKSAGIMLTCIFVYRCLIQSGCIAFEMYIVTARSTSVILVFPAATPTWRAALKCMYKHWNPPFLLLKEKEL